MKTEAITLLEALTEAHAVSGHEDEVRGIFKESLQGVGTLGCDALGSVYSTLSTGDERNGVPRVLVAGHMDEVGFLVQNITLDGFIQFVAVGGWWMHNLLAQRVVVKNQRGEKILGLVASKPPHFLPEGQRKSVMPIEALHVDIGASSREEVIEEFGICLGDPIAPLSEFTQMRKEDLYMAKAFDNRVGMAGAIQTALELKSESISNELIVAGTVQEEVGLRGAKTLAHTVQPDVAIVLEGPPADDIPGFSKADAQGALGGGVQIRLFDPTAIGHPRLAKHVQKVAKDCGINHQVTVRRSGGTDAGSFSLANSGVPSIVLGTPARYIHSHNAMIDINDYLAMVDLSVALVKSLNAETVAGLRSF